MHRWSFFRAGGFDQVVLATGADLANVGRLDQKLWVALSCPTKGLEFDQKTLDLVDTDHDGRIRVPELVAAIGWTAARLVSLDGLVLGASELRLDQIDTRSAEGRAVLASANRVLADLGKAGAQVISVDDTTDTVRIFAATTFNGDGIVTPATASDDDTRKVIEEIGECLGTLTDRSGKPGVDQAKVDTFFADARAHSEWWARSETDLAILPLGEATPAAFAAFAAVRAKVEDFFTRTRLAAFDPRATAALNRQESDYVALSARELTAASPELVALPLARVEPDAALPLGAAVSPAWAERVATFRDAAVRPLLGERDRLTADEWVGLVARLAPYEAWSATPAGASVCKLGLARIRAILATDVKARIDDLVAKDKALEPEASAIAEVDRLVRYHRDLFRLCNNFVSFRDFYARQKAVFQAGTLYVDQRSCDLCLRVEDVGKHSALAAASRAYLAYCECVRKATGDKITIVAALTGGDADNLAVGRNGVFYDRQGRDWDATITKIVDNPISLRQAFWAPYKKGLKFVEDQVAAFAASKDRGVEDATLAGVTGAAQTATAGAPPPEAQPFDVAKFAGVFAAIGLAIGAVGGALATTAAAFVSLEWWQMPLAIAGVMTAISGPSMLIASLKLRQRNLGPLLDASGWAVNARAKINIPFGESLTGIAALPPGSSRTARDPYAESRSGRNVMVLTSLIVVVVIGAWFFGALNHWLPFLPKSSYVLQREAASAPPATETAPTP